MALEIALALTDPASPCCYRIAGLFRAFVDNLLFTTQAGTHRCLLKVRKQISGRWLVTYSASVSYHETEARYVTCDIKENLIRKLEFEFAIVGSPIFQNQNGQIVKDIALRETDAGRYSLFYYFETERKLVESLRSLLIIERDQREEIIIETLGILNFEAPVSDRQSVQEMSGKWYDLNGNMMRILELARLKKEADLRHEIFAPIAFNKIPVSDIHFDADMGSVTFSFQGKRD